MQRQFVFWLRLQVRRLLDLLGGSLLGTGVAVVVFADLQLLRRAHSAR